MYYKNTNKQVFVSDNIFFHFFFMELDYYLKEVFKCHLNVSHSSALETKTYFPHVGMQELLVFLSFSFKNCTHHYVSLFAKEVFPNAIWNSLALSLQMKAIVKVRLWAWEHLPRELPIFPICCFGWRIQVGPKQKTLSAQFSTSPRCYHMPLD